MKLVIIIIIAVILILDSPQVISYIKKKKKERELNFNEFDDIGKIRRNREYSEKQLHNEWVALNKNLKINYKNKEENIYEGATINAIKKDENTFDTELFKKWSKEIFKCIKLGTREEIDVVKDFMLEEMYDRFIYQDEQFNEDGLQFVKEDLLIEEVKILDYGRRMAKEEIKIYIKAKIKEYIKLKDTNKVIRGNKHKAKEKVYIMTFIRQNLEGQEGFITNCPSCGAEIAETEFGKCRYCGSLVFPIRYNWTLTKFQTL